jgi:hypothetical protein
MTSTSRHIFMLAPKSFNETAWHANICFLGANKEKTANKFLYNDRN